MTLTDLIQTLAAALALVGSLVAVVVSINRAGAEKRNINEQAVKNDADASLTYGDLAERTAVRLTKAETEIESLKTKITEMQANQDKLSRYISYQAGIIDRLIAQLVSHDLSPVTRPVSLEDFK